MPWDQGSVAAFSPSRHSACSPEGAPPRPSKRQGASSGLVAKDRYIPRPSLLVVVISRLFLSERGTSLSVVVMKRISRLITTIERLEACASLEVS